MIEKGMKIDGVAVVYNYPAAPPYDIKIGVKYAVEQKDKDIFIAYGESKTKLSEQELRTFFDVYE